MTAEDAAFHARLSAADIDAAASADPDDPPMSAAEGERARSARFVRLARQSTGLSQTAFAHRYGIGVARLRDLEQGRRRADSALVNYLTIIMKEPDAVHRALDVA